MAPHIFGGVSHPEVLQGAWSSSSTIHEKAKAA